MVQDEIRLLGVTRKIAEERIFDAAGTFWSIGLAETYIRTQGYSAGSMQRDEPIALVKNTNENVEAVECQDGVIRRYLPKWRGINSDDVKLLDGVLLPMPDFREGGVQVLFFHPFENA